VGVGGGLRRCLGRRCWEPLCVTSLWVVIYRGLLWGDGAIFLGENSFVSLVSWDSRRSLFGEEIAMGMIVKNMDGDISWEVVEWHL